MACLLRLALARVCDFGLVGSLCLSSCGGSPAGTTGATTPGPIASALHYLKASNTGADDQFGWTMALSADGSTLAIGAPYESSNATGIDQDAANDLAYAAGAVYLFVRSGSTWVQQAYVKASNTEDSDGFGTSVALSANGDLLAVGAAFEDSSSTGFNGAQDDNAFRNAGAVYAYTLAGTAWHPWGYIKAGNAGERDEFGSSVALSGDGRTLIVGAPRERSNAVGVDGNQSNDSTYDAGATYVLGITTN